MSTTIDQRVVEMRFDNKNFENNVRTTMSTLDNLKQRLNLTGASKGLENIDSAAKKVNMNGLGNAVETVHAKFSALEVMGVTALANITNSAVNAGKKMLSALTIDPIKTGFQEYETQINAVQTILANTSHNGTTLDQVNSALDTLNTYADKTIYNFTEMTKNIGTFTAAGVDLQTSVESIQGIANLAAVSGSTSQQASTAMYQLSQALAAGKVSLMDWNSVVNAGMGGKIFQDALVRTSELLKTGAKGAIETYGSFRESLTKGEWLTTEVLTETLKQLSGAYTEADLIAQGYTEEQAKEITQLAQTATDAATKVKTFTQLWDTLKESAQSGWTQTWELIVGDFEESKEFLTGLSEKFGKIIEASSNARNKLLEGALGSKWDQFEKKINEAGISTEKFQTKLSETMKEHGYSLEGVIKRYGSLEKAISSGAVSSNIIIETLKKFAGVESKAAGATEDMTGKLEYFQKVVNDVWQGDYKNGEERVKALTKAGYDYATVQDLVNKTVDGHKLTLEDLSDAQLENLGYTEKEIKAIKKLAEEAEKTGTPINELINDLQKPSGRELLLDTLNTGLDSVLKILGAVKNAWTETFSIDSNELYSFIEGLNTFTHNLAVSDDTADDLKRTLKGVFAIIGMVTDVLGGGFKIAFKALNAILAYFDTDILSVTASIGDALVAFRKATDLSTLFGKAIEFVAPYLADFIENVQDWASAFAEIPQVQKVIDSIKNSFTKLKELDFKEFGKNIIDGLVNGLGDGAGQVVKNIINLAKDIIIGFCEILGIHSPSREFFSFGQNIIEGLVNGIQNGFSAVIETIKGLTSKIIDFFSKINWGTVLAGGISIGMLLTVKKIADGFASLTAPFEGLGDVFESTSELIEKSTKGVGKILKGFGKVLSSFAFSIKAKAIKNIAISLAILVGAVALLTFVDTGKLWSAVGAVAVITVILIALVGVVEGLAILSAKFGSGSIDFGKLSLGLLGISASILLIAGAAKLIGSIENAEQAFKGLAGIVGGLIAVIAAYGLLVKGDAAQNINKLGGMLIKLSLSMLLLVGVVKLVSKLSWDEMGKGGAFALAFVGFVALLGGITTYSKSIDGLGGMILKLSLSMLLLVGIVKLVGKLSWGEMFKGAVFAVAFVAFVGVLVKVTQSEYGRQIHKLGGLLLSISLSMLLMVGLCKLVGMLTPGEMIKGGAFVAAFMVMVWALVKITTIGSDQQIAKVTGTLLAMSVAIGILAGVSILLSIIDTKGLVKGIAAVGFLSLFMMGMIAATKNANDCKGNLIAMSVAIGVMAVAVAALSFIDWTKLAPATIALGTLMGMFALIAKAAGSINGAMGSLIVMTVAIGVLAGALYLLTKLPVDSMLGTAASLSILLLSLATSIKIIGKSGSVSPMALVSIGVMTLVIGALAGILYLIQGLETQSAMTNAISLSILLVTITGVAALLGAMSGLLTAAVPAVVSLGIVIGELAILLAAMGGLAQIPGLEWLISEGGTFLQSIGTAIGQFVGGIVGGIAEGVASVLPAIGASLSGFMINIQGFIAGAQNINESALIGVGYLSAALLLLTAAEFVAGIAAIGGLSLVALGLSLTGFIIAALPFLTIIQTVDPASVEAAKTLAEMILVLTAAELLSGIADFLGGDTDFASFGEQLVAFGSAVCAFSNILTQNGGINEEAVTAAANAGKVMAGLQSSLYGAGGLKQDIFGEKDLSVFGSQLVAFGSAICEFSNTLTQNGGINEEAVTSAANAGTVMAELQNSLYGAGGLKQDIFGEKDLSVFAIQLVAFGNAICDFSNTLTDNGGIDSDAIESAANAGKTMAALQNEIETAGGLKADIFGDKDLSTFGTQIVAFGQAIVDFSDKVAGNISEDAVTAAANAGQVMAEVQKAIPEDKWLDGKISLDDFGDKIVKFGEGLVKYSEKVVEVDSAAVSNSLSSAKSLVSLAKSVVDLDTSGIDAFKSVKTIGSTIKDYYEKISEVDFEAVSSSISSVKKIISAVTSMAGLDVSGISSFKTAIDELGKVNLDGFVKTFSSATTKLSSTGSNMITSLIKGITAKKSSMTSAGAELVSSLTKGITSKTAVANNIVTALMNNMVKTIDSKKTIFNSTGSALMSQLATGINKSGSKVKNAATTSVSGAITSIRGYYDNFYNAGGYLVDGFVAGIEDNISAAAEAAAAMANAAEKAAKEALDINSPSKVFRSLGYSVPEGFAVGIDRMSAMVKGSSVSMADVAINTVSKSIARISDAINSDISNQPTIRPVLDLSDVKSGAGMIGNLLNNEHSFGVTANAGAISVMMNQRNQNGTNSDVVTAINKLRKDLSNVGNTIYQIDGVTYDDGSSISSAVEAIVDAARIERRV